VYGAFYYLLLLLFALFAKNKKLPFCVFTKLKLLAQIKQVQMDRISAKRIKKVLLCFYNKITICYCETTY
jgi:hypothetical protein